MKCEKCGSEVSKGRYYCDKCGNKIKSSLKFEKEITENKIDKELKDSITLETTSDENINQIYKHIYSYILPIALTFIGIILLTYILVPSSASDWDKFGYYGAAIVCGGALTIILGIVKTCLFINKNLSKEKRISFKVIKNAIITWFIYLILHIILLALLNSNLTNSDVLRYPALIFAIFILPPMTIIPILRTLNKHNEVTTREAYLISLLVIVLSILPMIILFVFISVIPSFIIGLVNTNSNRKTNTETKNDNSKQQQKK